jgi:3-oxoacyl-[acyl-carrier protein] reductase
MALDAGSGTSYGTSLAGRTALVTGASRGIGFSTARALAEAGMELYLCSRPSGALEDAAETIRRAGGRAEILAADLSDPGAAAGLARMLKERVSRLDVLVNNAGQALSSPVEETGDGDWDRIMTVNARSPYILTRDLLPLMESSDLKTVVNIASVVSVEGYPLQSAYTASKHALIGFSKSLARELQDRKYRVHVISPGGVATGMVTGVRPDIDKDELIHPDEIAEWILFLLTRRGKGMVDHIRIRRESKLPW